MYKVEYLPVAESDLIEIVKYISQKLMNSQAAVKLAENIIASTESLANFPHAYPIYYPLKRLKYDYRKMLVENYLVFYTVNDNDKTVTISRIIYAKRNYNTLLD